MIRFLCVFLIFNLFVRSSSAQQKRYNAAEIRLNLEKLNTLGSVLYVAAHPDDENTRLLSYYANEKHFRATYISMTRGDGGQNLIGSEQGELLGVIRTQELLAARRIDGAEQVFSRAVDFGYSKNPEETFSFWNKDSILADVVWAIRKVRPDIIVMRFPTTGEGGHGHHTASAILAVEAFKAAADPSRFPEQLKYVQTWQSERIFWNMFRPKEEEVKGKPDITGVDIGSFNYLLGKSYGELASESRSMHKSQGFGTARSRGKQLDYLKLIDGTPFLDNELSGINTTWNRVKGGEAIAADIQKIIASFSEVNPSNSIPALFELRKKINTEIKDDYWKNLKSKEVEELILACGGFFIEAFADISSVAPGEQIKITASVIHRSDERFTLNDVRFNDQDSVLNSKLEQNILFNAIDTIVVPSSTVFSNPYWLNNKHGSGIYSVKDQLQIGLPDNIPAMNATFRLKWNNEELLVNRPVVYKWVDPVKGELYRALEILPPVSIILAEKVFVFGGQGPRQVHLKLKAGISNVKGVFKLPMPSGWTCEPNAFPFDLVSKEDEVQTVFTITPPKSDSEIHLQPVVEIGRVKYSKTLERLTYDHIPIQTMVRDCEIKLVHFSITTPALRVAYIEGAGDKIPECLNQLGYTVRRLDDESITNGDLSQYDVIITGIRAYNTNERMPIYQPKLMEYVKNGGTLFVQYNTSNFLSTLKTEIGPYPFKITRDRVTDENAKITILDSTDEIVNRPNKISITDFDGWIQERGIYFAGEYGSNYKTIFTMNDPGEKPSEGSVIVGPYGKGNFVYSGLVFFRELPAGVPGAYRLFVNLMSVGRNKTQ